MRKLLIIIPLCILCFGCGKDRDIVINIYENGESKIEEKVEQVESKTIVENKNEEEKEENTQSKTSELTEKAKTTYDKAKNWYDDNKDELKEINHDIIQDDLDTIGGVFDKIRNWYNDKNIKDEVKEIYNEDKNSIKDLIGKLKNNE